MNKRRCCTSNSLWTP